MVGIAAELGDWRHAATNTLSIAPIILSPTLTCGIKGSFGLLAATATAAAAVKANRTAALLERSMIPYVGH